MVRAERRRAVHHVLLDVEVPQGGARAVRGPSAGEWVEITRESIAARTALAKRQEPAVPVPASATVATASAGLETTAGPAAVVVRINGADVVVPEGVSESHAASVLRAVASL